MTGGTPILGNHHILLRYLKMWLIHVKPITIFELLLKYLKWVAPKSETLLWNSGRWVPPMNSARSIQVSSRKCDEVAASNHGIAIGPDLWSFLHILFLNIIELFFGWWISSHFRWEIIAAGYSHFPLLSWGRRPRITATRNLPGMGKSGFSMKYVMKWQLTQFQDFLGFCRVFFMFLWFQPEMQWSLGGF